MMIKIVESSKKHKFFMAYSSVICLYMLLLRLVVVPPILSYLVYGAGVVVAFVELTKNGLCRIGNRFDVKLIVFFSLYYFISSIIYVGFASVGSIYWLPKDWLYSLLPMFFYIFFRLSKRTWDSQLLLSYTLYSILIIDIVSFITFLAPNSSISRLFDQEMLVGEAVSFALSGILGVIGSGFVNVIAFAICILSPIKINKIIRVIISVICIVCVFMSGQRTPLGGVLIVTFVAILKYEWKSIWGIILAVLLLGFLYKRLDFQVNNFSVKESMTERYIYRLNSVSGVDSGREDQHIVNNNDNLITILFGEGVCKYSQENPWARLVLSDAMLYRIYNEMGLLGILCFTLFFIYNFVKALKAKNAFMIAVIIYAFFANYFNRVLFVAPMSIIPYLLIAHLNWTDKDEINKIRIHYSACI